MYVYDDYIIISIDRLVQFILINPSLGNLSVLTSLERLDVTGLPTKDAILQQQLQELFRLI